MQSNILSKENFIEIMNDLEEVSNYQNGLNRFFREHNVDGYIFQPDCSSSVIKLLHIIFGKADENDWIEKFCFILNYGQKWKSEMFTDKNGTDIRLSTPEELYELLTECNNQGDSL